MTDLGVPAAHVQVLAGAHVSVAQTADRNLLALMGVLTSVTGWPPPGRKLSCCSNEMIRRMISCSSKPCS